MRVKGRDRVKWMGQSWKEDAVPDVFNRCYVTAGASIRAGNSSLGTH